MDLAAGWAFSVWMYVGLQSVVSETCAVPYQAWCGGTFAVTLVSCAAFLFGGPREFHYGLTDFEISLIFVAFFTGVVRTLLGRVWAMRAACAFFAGFMVHHAIQFLSLSDGEVEVVVNLNNNFPHIVGLQKYSPKSCLDMIFSFLVLFTLETSWLNFEYSIFPQVRTFERISTPATYCLRIVCAVFACVITRQAFGMLSIAQNPTFTKPLNFLSGPKETKMMVTSDRTSSYFVSFVILPIFSVGSVFLSVFAASSLAVGILLVAQAINHLGPSESIYFAQACSVATVIAILAGIFLAGTIHIRSSPCFRLGVSASVAAMMVVGGLWCLSPADSVERRSMIQLLRRGASLDVSDIADGALAYLGIGLAAGLSSLYLQREILRAALSPSASLHRLTAGASVSAVLVVNAVERLGAAESPAFAAACEGLSLLVLVAVVAPTALTQSPPRLLRALCGLLSLHMLGAGAHFLSPRRAPAGDDGGLYPRAWSAITMSYLGPALLERGLTPDVLGESAFWGVAVVASVLSWAAALAGLRGRAGGSLIPAALVASVLTALNATLLLGPSEGPALREHLRAINLMFVACSVPPLVLRFIAVCLPAVGLLVSIHAVYVGFGMLESSGEASYLASLAYAATLISLAGFSAVADSGNIESLPDRAHAAAISIDPEQVRNPSV